jgi:hypothetical protein
MNSFVDQLHSDANISNSDQYHNNNFDQKEQEMYNYNQNNDNLRNDSFNHNHNQNQNQKTEEINCIEENQKLQYSIIKQRIGLDAGKMLNNNNFDRDYQDNKNNDEHQTSIYASNNNDSELSKFFGNSNNSHRNSILNNSNNYTSPKTKKSK